MQTPILIEPTQEGHFRAIAGEPFAASAEGLTAQEAVQLLEGVLRERLNRGSRLGVIELENGTAPASDKLALEQLPDDDWFFQTMREAIADNRRREDETQG
jgi:hypothetical protein